MTSFFKRVARWFKDEPQTSNEQPGAGEMLQNMMRSIDNTQEVEYDCAQVYQLLDQYADMVERGEDAAELMPLVRHHLEMCRDCREEYEALMRVLEHQTPDTA